MTKKQLRSGRRWVGREQTWGPETVLSLITDDVLFMVPGLEPFGKEEFAANSPGTKDHRLGGTSIIQEIKVLGDWAWKHNHLQITITAPDGK